jgi:hypothetical protein
VIDCQAGNLRSTAAALVALKVRFGNRSVGQVRERRASRDIPVRPEQEAV